MLTRQIVFLGGFLAIVACKHQGEAEMNIRLGMSRAEALRRLDQAGAVQVPKDIFPDPMGWAIRGRDECLFLAFTNNAVAGLSIELGSSRPKMFRSWQVTNSYSLR